jgi:DNA modification methylase
MVLKTAEHVWEESPCLSVFAGRSCVLVLDEVLAWCRESGRYFDTAFADPPFNWGVDYGKTKDKMDREDYAVFTCKWIAGLVEVVRPGGAVWINCPEDSLRLVLNAADSVGLKLRRQCVWHYRFGQNTPHNFISSHTNALYFVKPGDDHAWFPDRVMEMSDRALIYNDPRTHDKDEPQLRGKRVPLDVWYGPGFGRVQGNNKQRRGKHPNQLPAAYLSRVLLSTTPDRGLVIDPFLGSGTTAIQARALGFHAVGIEINEDYASSAFVAATASEKETV